MRVARLYALLVPALTASCEAGRASSKHEPPSTSTPSAIPSAASRTSAPEASQPQSPTPASRSKGTDPELLYKVMPKLPAPTALSAQSVVVLEAVIGADGRVKAVRPLRPGPSALPEWERSCVEGSKQWRYRPATFNGKPVEVYLTISFYPHPR